MDLPAYALISTLRCAERLRINDEDLPEEELPPLIGYASAAIRNHCGWHITREQSTIAMDSFGDGRLVITRKPVIQVVSLRYDTSRLFPVNTEVTGYTYIPSKSLIILPSANEYNEAVYQLTVDAGYTKIDYRQSTEEEPDDPVAGESWLNENGLFSYNGTLWVANADGIPMPDDLEATCAEYVHWLRIRFMAGGAGLIKKERGYSFEGSAVEYETSMPSHVRERLNPYVEVNV